MNRLAVFFLVTLAIVATPSRAESTWKQPPAMIQDVLNARDIPTAWLDPTDRTLVLADRLRYPPITDLAEPMLKLAGVRLDPRTNSLHAGSYFTSLTLKSIADGAERRVTLPDGTRVSRFWWAPNGERFAFSVRGENGIELWTGLSATAEVRRVEGLRLNPMLGSEAQWLPDSATLVVKRIPQGRGPAPVRPLRPDGPNVQASAGGSATSTYEARDVLTTAFDETLFDYHGASQVARVEAESGTVTDVGEAGVIASVQPSPDGRFLLVDRVHGPYTHRHAWWRFPHDIAAWDAKGALVKDVARLPLADAVPIQGVSVGPRGVTWRATSPATLVWLEALDGGDWARKAPHRDRVLAQDAPFDAPPRVIRLATHRVQGVWWGEQDGLMLVEEYERERRWRHGWALWPDASDRAPVKVVDVSASEQYADPGSPEMRALPSGWPAVVQEGSAIFRSGSGATPTGERPFLDKCDITTGKSERLFRSDAAGYEQFVTWLDVAKGTFLTRAESPKDPPNYMIRTLGGPTQGTVAAGEASWTSKRRALTSFPDPTPVLRDIGKRIVTFTRGDGVPQSFTLYTPPGWKEGQRLPTILYAYPLEFSDAGTAGQVSGTDRTFTRFGGPSHLFLLLSGYAILHDTTMPVIGDPDTAYDTFIEQLVLSAKAAVAKAIDLGVTDPERVGVMGHSHGALMTATLLAHSDIFRAGIARSGAYNHTMRPFGFQSERRMLWDAMDTYVRLSPVLHARKINEPLLLIHGEVDANPGTVPLQSEKLFEAVRGTGGTVRLVMLPHESHGYASREATEHVLAEQLAWFDTWVKDAQPRLALTETAVSGE